MELSKALRQAEAIVEQLQPHCDRIHIAGSIRRQKLEVKDIEVIAQPKTMTMGGDGLFGEVTRFESPIPAFRSAVEKLGRIKKGKVDGRYMQITLPFSIDLDLFMPEPYDYFRQYAIRTGSADYSARYIAAGWKRIGWCGTPLGLRKIVDCEEVKSGSKSTWRCINPNAELPPVWQSEQEFFEWLGVKWLEPRGRNL